MRETYHIEILGVPDRGHDTEVMQRRSVRASALAPVTERAMDLFHRARAPQRSGPPAEAVRIIDGAGTELFVWTATDEATSGRRR